MRYCRTISIAIKEESAACHVFKTKMRSVRSRHVGSFLAHIREFSVLISPAHLPDSRLTSSLVSVGSATPLRLNFSCYQYHSTKATGPDISVRVTRIQLPCRSPFPANWAPGCASCTEELLCCRRPPRSWRFCSYWKALSTYGNMRSRVRPGHSTRRSTPAARTPS